MIAAHTDIYIFKIEFEPLDIVLHTVYLKNGT